jgi:streptogramin lyase
MFFGLALLVVLHGIASAQIFTIYRDGITPASGPIGIAAGPDGNVWFTEGNAGRIGRITPDGFVTEFSVGISPVSAPHGIVAGPDGNLWFTETGVSRIGRITPSGVFTEFYAGISSFSTPIGITAGPDGNLWFTEYDGHRIGRITPGGIVTEFSSASAGIPNPDAITAGPDGNLWFTDSVSARIGRITPSGVITVFSAGIAFGAQIQGITAGPDGNLWFTETSGNRIGRITPEGFVTEFSAGISPGAAPFGITAGPDGNLWFTELSGYRIGRITPAGVVTEFDRGIGPDGGSFWGIAAGPDGNLWFAINSNVIGQITTGVHPPYLRVVEYYHAGFDHYFMTPVPAEIALLDARVHPFEGWSRTGLSFNAYLPATAPGLSVGVCRFFNIFFAPKSSHFYAPRGFGCESTLTMFPDWGLEDEKLFNAMLPDAAGTCPSGTIPVYRLYNNGMGGAPNHRFVTHLSEQQDMINKGYVAEGSGIGVGMCVPP